MLQATIISKVCMRANVLKIGRAAKYILEPGFLLDTSIRHALDPVVYVEGIVCPI